MSSRTPSETPEALLERLERGHWFLKHRAKGDKPHSRFVFIEGPCIYWGAREDRSGKLGCMRADSQMLVVPGLASAVLNRKQRLQSKRNRLFSAVSATRSLDLEVPTEAERHVWVKAFNAFAQLHTQTESVLDAEVGPVLEIEEPDTGAALQSQLARVDTAQIMHGVKFPKLQNTLQVRQGSLTASWASWSLTLAEGRLTAGGHGVLPLCHATLVEVTSDATKGHSRDDDSRGLQREEDDDATASVSSAGTTARGPQELAVHLVAAGGTSLDGGVADDRAGGSNGGGGGAGRGGDGGTGEGEAYGGGGGSGLALPPLVLRGAAGVLARWHAGLTATCNLLADIGGSRPWSYTEAFMPLDAEEIEQELNEMFDACFELCAYDTHAALAEMSGPLWERCHEMLRRHSSSMPPRPDVFAQKAEGVHRRYANMVHTLLVRHDLDRQYLQGCGSAQHGTPAEPLEPSVMLRMIGWSHAYSQKMERLGGSLPGQPRALLSEEAVETLISSFLRACRSVSLQLMRNIIFCEQQTMLQRHFAEKAGEKAGDESALSHGILLLDAGGGGGGGGGVAGGGGGGVAGGGGGGGGRTGALSLGSGGKLYFTEMHIDVFRIVHEQVELALATSLEELIFNVMLAMADFLIEVQNELLSRLRRQWRSLGFLYLFASINNASRCAELWADVLTTSLRRHRRDGCGLGDALGGQMHLDYVSAGFGNLANAATQLACCRIIMQLEPSLNELFRAKQAHHTPREMGALIAHFLGLLQGGVILAYAHRAAGLCLELLLTVYGAMLFVQTAPLGPETPQKMRDDLDVFAQLLATHSTDAGAPAPTRARAERLHALLRGVAQLIAALLEAPPAAAAAGAAAGGAAADPHEAVCGHVAKLRALDATLSLELLTRIVSKCKSSPLTSGRRRAALLRACDQALGTGLPGSGGPGEEATAAAAPVETRQVLFFARMAECVRMGRAFSVQRVLELRDGDVRP